MVFSVPSSFDKRPRNVVTMLCPTNNDDINGKRTRVMVDHARSQGVSNNREGGVTEREKGFPSIPLFIRFCASVWRGGRRYLIGV